MKKSVVIIIGIIYGLSIVLVTLFGIKHQSFNEVIYVNQVEIIEENASYKSDGSKYITLSPDENGDRTYQLVWKVTPENANNTSVSIIYDESKQHVNIDENGLVTFTARGSVEVTIQANDSTQMSDSITIIFR